MRTRVASTIAMALSLEAFVALPTAAQYEGPSPRNDPALLLAQGNEKMPHDQMKMANEPHHILAMAHHQNVLIFAQALRDQTHGASSVNVDFARDAVAEMRRSCDHMKKHHKAHTGTMTAEMRSSMGEMMQHMQTHHTELNTQLTKLEREVKTRIPDVAKVSSLAAGIHAQLGAMMESKPGNQKSKT